MAEVVHRELEEMLPSLEDMEKHGLFSRDETKAIIKKRRDFEYKLKRRQSQKKDYLHYIQYELTLDALRRKRKVRLGVTRENMKSEFHIVRHTHYVFNRMLKKFPGDYMLWLQYFALCRHMKSVRVLGKAYARALSYHSLVPELWIEAAKFEFEENANIKAARVLLQRGLRLNKDSQLLWREYFRLELLYWEKMTLRRKVLGLDLPVEEARANEESEDGVLSNMDNMDDASMEATSETENWTSNLTGDETANQAAQVKFFAAEVPKIVYENAIKAHPEDVAFRMMFIDIYRLFEGTEAMQLAVLEDLKKSLGNKETTWDAMARYKAKPGEESKCFQAEAVYQAAFKALPTSTMHELHCRYLTECLDLATNDNDSMHSASRRLLVACQQAAAAGLANAYVYKLWSTVVLRRGEVSEAVHIANEGSLQHPMDIDLTRWNAVLSARANSAGVSANPEEAFQRAVEADKGEVQTWLLWLDYQLANGSRDIEKTFHDAVNAVKDKDGVLCAYIDWTMQTNGIKGVRSLFKRLQGEGYGTVALASRCIAIERLQKNPSLDKIRSLHEWVVQSDPKNH
eukprot:Ihof_evm6s211 gene=Ihof_evmTU6s211